jgi:alpha-1,3-rhamnosyl/mannosyltransferase
VPADDLPALLTGAAVAAYPSLYEGFGLPVVEAMAHGAPTVTSDRSSMPELAGDAAFLVDPYDVGDIARGLETALRAADTDRAGIAARAAQQASRFTWERAARSMLDIYLSRFG